VLLLIINSQHVLEDVVVSNKHLRIYTIVFDEDESDGIAPLVYAEDLSRNGTYWNGNLIGKGNGGVLLGDGDTLRVSPRIYYHFRRCGLQEEESPFDLTQECEMKVGKTVHIREWC
jgi:FHA domain